RARDIGFDGRAPREASRAKRLVFERSRVGWEVPPQGASCGRTFSWPPWAARSRSKPRARPFDNEPKGELAFWGQGPREPYAHARRLRPARSPRREEQERRRRHPAPLRP